MENDKVLDTFYDITINDICKVPVITIYESPADYPDYYVARLWEGATNKSTPYITVRKTIEELDDTIPDYMTYLPPFDGDEEHIKGAYI